MRFDEFKVNERQKLKEMYPHLTEEQLDEILQALAPVGAAVATGARVAGQAAVKAGQVGAKMGAKAAPHIAKAGQAAGKMAVKGAIKGAKIAGKVGKQVAQQAQKVGAKVGNMAAQKLLKIGNTMPIGGQEVKIDSVSGDEVTLADPKKRDAPKTVIKKKDPVIQQALKNLIS